MDAEQFYRETVNDKINFDLSTHQGFIHTPEFLVEFAEKYYQYKLELLLEDFKNTQK